VAGEAGVWTVRVLDDLRPEDLQLVADFFNEHFPGVFYPMCSPEIWRWKLGASNPAGPGFLTVAYLDGKVIGTTSGTRQKIRLNGQTVSGMEIGDTFTQPEYRKSGFCGENYPGTVNKDDYLNKSVFGRLVAETLDRATKAGVQYVFGTPNLNSRPPYISKLGFKEIGFEKVKSWNSINSKYVISARYKIPLYLSITLLTSAVKVNTYLIQRKFSIRETSFGEMADGIGTHVRVIESTAQESDSLCFEQNLNFYQHRYDRHPNHLYRYFAVEGNEKLIGWLICTQIKRSSGRVALVISDWIAFDETFKGRLPNFISLVSRKFPDAELISVWAANDLAKRSSWNRFGFFSVKDVSIIERCIKIENSQPVVEFANFRIGWSDNG
jgi:hypothetical protein